MIINMNSWGSGSDSGKIVTVNVIPGTGASVTCTDGKQTFTGTTDSSGNAVFKLAKGAWTITAMQSGVSVSQNVTITADCTINLDLNQIPVFTYTGSYQIVDDNDNDITSTIGNWKIRFLTSGTLTFTNLRGAANGIDVFLVGGGGNGGANSGSSTFGCSGGGGGYTKTVKAFSVTTTSTYNVVVGGSAGNTSAFGYTANAGKSGAGWGAGGDGGSGGGAMYGGGGGSDGGNGGKGGYSQGPGTGQGSTTREFGESKGTLYAGGGGGGSKRGGSPGAGGSGGGGKGAKCDGADVSKYTAASSGSANTGGGGGGSCEYHYGEAKGSGGSGIVIIRNKR